MTIFDSFPDVLEHLQGAGIREVLVGALGCLSAFLVRRCYRWLTAHRETKFSPACQAIIEHLLSEEAVEKGAYQNKGRVWSSQVTTPNLRVDTSGAPLIYHLKHGDLTLGFSRKEMKAIRKAAQKLQHTLRARARWREAQEVEARLRATEESLAPFSKAPRKSAS